MRFGRKRPETLGEATGTKVQLTETNGNSDGKKVVENECLMNAVKVTRPTRP